MPDGADFYTTEEAAHLLGVTPRRVQQMLHAGTIAAFARGLVDAHSVSRYKNSAEGGRTRVWAEHTAWGAVAMLSGVRPEWLGDAQTSRLRKALNKSSIRELVVRTRDRATTHTYLAHPAAAERLRSELVVTDSFSLGLVEGLGIDGIPYNGLSQREADERLNGYYPASGLSALVNTYVLKEHPSGNVTVRVTDFDLDVVRDLAESPTRVLTALDATTALDPRERGLGMLALRDALRKQHHASSDD